MCFMYYVHCERVVTDLPRVVCKTRYPLSLRRCIPTEKRIAIKCLAPQLQRTFCDCFTFYGREKKRTHARTHARMNAGSEKIFRAGPDVYSAVGSEKSRDFNKEHFRFSHTRAYTYTRARTKEEKTLTKFHIQRTKH